MNFSKTYVDYLEAKLKKLSNNEFSDIKKLITELILIAYQHKSEKLEPKVFSVYSCIVEDIQTQQELSDFLKAPRAIWEKYIIIFILSEVSIRKIIKAHEIRNDEDEVYEVFGINFSAFGIPTLYSV